MSGQNPGGHGIFGFIDRTLPDLSLLLPNAANRQGTSLWGILNQYHIPVIVMNVPVTYPPEKVNGILIGGFLGVDVKKIAFPSSDTIKSTNSCAASVFSLNLTIPIGINSSIFF